MASLCHSIMIYCVNSMTRTPLHCAASCNNLNMVHLLVENGAAVYSQTVGDNETPADKCELSEMSDSVSQYLLG